MPDLARHMRVWRHGMIRELVGDGRGRIWTWEKFLFPTVHPLIPVLDRVSTSKHSRRACAEGRSFYREMNCGLVLLSWSDCGGRGHMHKLAHSRIQYTLGFYEHFYHCSLVVPRARGERNRYVCTYCAAACLFFSCSGSCLTTRRTWRWKNPQ